MSDIHENLEKIKNAVWGKDVRQAIHDSIHDCYEDGRAGGTDLIAREMITAVETAKADKVDLAREISTRTTEIAVERSRVDQIVAKLGSDEVRKTLWTGSAKLENTTFEIDGVLSDYDYLDIALDLGGKTQIQTVYATEGTKVLRVFNIPNDPVTGKIVGASEITLTVDTTNNVLMIREHLLFTWNYVSQSVPTLVKVDDVLISSATIYQIDGRKIVENIETSDIRIGADGTVYDTAGDAVRGQISDLKEDLNNQYIKEFYEVVKSPNMIDGEDSLTTGYMAKTGSVDHTTTSMCYTDYIPVSEGDVVRAYQIASRIFSNRHLRMMCCFDANKAVMSSVGNNNDMALFTVPAGVSYIRATLYDSAAVTDHMLTLNYEATKFEPYGEQYVVTKDFLTSESQNAVDALVNNAYTRKLVANRYACGAPKQGLKMTIELQQPWYIESLISQPFLSIQLGAAGEVKRYEDRVEFICTTPKDGGSGYKFNVYDEVFGSMLFSANTYVPSGYGLPVKWANLNLSDCSLLAIGDSTVDQDTMTAKILEEFTAQNHTITLLGTLGSGLNKNEGRAGWKATDYLTNRQYEGTVNPFYNPTTQTFDFDYYMTNQGYTAPDFVVIQLGINDLYNLTYDAVPTAIETTWNAIKTMIDSILAYDANIKIILNLPTTPKNDITAHTAFLPLYRNTRMMYNDYAQEQARAYSINKVRVSYCHLILNADTDIYDTVHPNNSGYSKMAKEIVSQINVWQN